MAFLLTRHSAKIGMSAAGGCCSVAGIAERNSTKLNGCSACLRHPVSPRVRGCHDGAAFAHCRSVVRIYEGNIPQGLCCSSGLNRLAVSVIGRPDNCPILTNDCASASIHKGSAAKIVSLWKWILPAPLRIWSGRWDLTREGK